MKKYDIFLGYGKDVKSVDEFSYMGITEGVNEEQAILNLYNIIEIFVGENAIFKISEKGKQKYSYYTFGPNFKEVEK